MSRSERRTRYGFTRRELQVALTAGFWGSAYGRAEEPIKDGRGWVVRYREWLSPQVMIARHRGVYRDGMLTRDKRSIEAVDVGEELMPISGCWDEVDNITVLLSIELGYVPHSCHLEGTGMPDPDGQIDACMAYLDDLRMPDYRVRDRLRRRIDELARSEAIT